MLFEHIKFTAAHREVAAFRSKPASHWEKKGEGMALKLFLYCAKHVPAYKKMLEREGINPKQVKTIKQFKELPLLNKSGYLRKFKYNELFPNGTVPIGTTISATSGSTGEPFFFPRDEAHDTYYSKMLETLFTNQWEADVRRTLCLVGFGLGIWIGGVFTYKNLNALVQRGYPLTVAPVGLNIPMLIKTFQAFARHYDQIILMSYPPFLKDLLDEGRAQGIDWTKHRLRILTAAEGYSEKFRNYLADVSGADPVNDMVNIYGTVEQGTIAHETAFANLIRRVAGDNRALFKALFPKASNVPTLAQYDPRHVYFEEIDGALAATGYGSAIPLVRYTFSDLGGVIAFDAMLKLLKQNGIDIMREATKHGIKNKVLRLPFVYVYARSDFAIVLRGANIYPDEIRASLDSRVLRESITGRFTAIKRESSSGNQTLHLHIELKKGVRAQPKIQVRVLNVLITDLCARNSEFNNNYVSDPKSSTPKIYLHPFKDKKYFDRMGKQKWIQI